MQPWSVSSVVERFVHTEDVVGSNPIPTTIFQLSGAYPFIFNAILSQTGAGNTILASLKSLRRVALAT